MAIPGLKSALIPLFLILVLPLLGLRMADHEILPYLSFPPTPGSIPHAPFSMPVFGLITAVVLAALIPLARMGLQPQTGRKRTEGPLPWWGWVSLALFILFWILAWTRTAWFAPFQAHTFFPLWLSLILVINAVTLMRSSTCPLTEQPGKFILLFPVSALFWWSFEYLNRFVGNWIYTGSDYGPGLYFILATVSFSTVLPAVESMKALVMTFGRVTGSRGQVPPLPFLDHRMTGAAFTGLGCVSLLLIPLFPDPLFFTVWIAPLLVFWGWALLAGKPHALSSLARGDLTPVISYALAAVCCGFFWEMLNLYSLARWTYSIPYVDVLHLFEMPVLGYAGYLPFGLECAMIVHLVYGNG